MIGFENAPAATLPPENPSIVERMAETMRDMRAAGMTVTARALAVYGDYADADIERHGEEAAALARARAVRRLA
ncbi:hypothetical protein [Mesorhizobium sp. KR9-304]|uniref:hypothetical protein n=1 Tax=Mesorhizobium sp. KR9-304 TaxID=3156614 RepID=UPI0032B42D0A